MLTSKNAIELAGAAWAPRPSVPAAPAAPPPPEPPQPAAMTPQAASAANAFGRVKLASHGVESSLKIHCSSL